MYCFKKALLSIAAVVAVVMITSPCMHADIYESDAAARTAIAGVGGSPTSSRGTEPSGLLSNSVDLYTGQHYEAFPIASIPGRSGFGFAVNLTYNSGSALDAKVLNRYRQASSVGLGFDLGMESILSENLGTVRVGDDRYRYLVGENALDLVLVSENEFRVKDGRPWKITRHVQASENAEIVIGWTVVKEDGSIYRFGDFDQGQGAHNASRYTLRWGTSLAPGLTIDAALYPYQWDLRVVRDADSINSVLFEYSQEIEQVRVYNGGTPSYTTNSFTRASYPFQITAAGGFRLKFVLGNRLDFERYHPTGRIQFYQTKRIDSIVVLGLDGSVQSRIALLYNYLNAAADSTRKKLILTSIAQVANDESASLPPTSFSYYAQGGDIYFGALQTITYSPGAVKSITYKNIEADSTYAQLQATLAAGYYYYHFGAANNTLILDAQQPHDKIGLGIWNGYWQNTTISDFNAEKDDYPAASSDGWVAWMDRSSNSIVARRWDEGYWRSDTIPLLFTPFGSRLRLIPGNDFVFAYDISYTGPNGSAISRHFYFYKWDGLCWSVYEAYDADHAAAPSTAFHVLNVGVSSDGVMMHLGYQDNDTYRTCTINARCVDLPCFFFPNGKPVVPPYAMTRSFKYTNYSSGSGIDVSQSSNNFCAWESSNLNVEEWDGYNWQSRTPLDTTEYTPTYARGHGNFVTTSSAVVWEHKEFNDVIDKTDHYLMASFLGTNGWTRVSRKVGETTNRPFMAPDFFDAIQSAANLVTTRHNSTLVIWNWNGTGWDSTKFGDISTEAIIRVLDNTVVCQSNGRLIAKKYVGNGTWGPTDTLIVTSFVESDGYPKDIAFACQEDYIVAMGLSPTRFLVFKWVDNDWQMTDLSPQVSLASFTGFSAVSSPGAFWAVIEHAGSSENQYCFKWFGSTCTGKASTPVVSQVSLKTDPSDAHPSAIAYSYFGGLLDEAGRVPRFARAKVSVPFFPADGSPVGYSVHHFFNDIDTSGFAYPEFYSIMPAPDLKPATRYGEANGGYKLDGREYLTYSYTVGDAPAKCKDTTRNYFSLSEAMTYPYLFFGPSIKRVVVDSVHVRTDSLPQDVKYFHDKDNGRPTSTRTRYAGTSSWLIDSVVYAHALIPTMGGANALTQVSKNLKVLDSAGTTRLLYKDSADWTHNSSWVRSKSYVWRKPSDDATKVLGASLLPGIQSFDQFGNIIASVNGNGDTSCVKFDVTGLLPVATAVNSYPKDFLAQDFEQPHTWDGWNALPSAYRWYETSGALTGKYSLKMIDNPSTSERNWGPEHSISKVDLTGTKYYFSGWVKTNHRIRIYCFCYDASGAICPNGYKFIPFDIFSDAQWKRIEGVFDLSDAWTCLNRISFQLVLEDGSSSVYALFDNIRFQPVDASVSTAVYSPGGGLSVGQAGVSNMPTISVYDKFDRPVESRNWLGQTISKQQYYQAVPFNPSQPNYVKATTYSSPVDSTVAVSFFDGLGRVQQTRSLGKLNGQECAIVSGLSTYDARGRILKTYKDYFDILVPTGLMDYSSWTQSMSELAAYFDGDPGTDCQGYPFAEYTYEATAKSKLSSTGGPGSAHRIGGGHTSHFLYSTDVAGNAFVKESWDPDNVKTTDRIDRWGRYIRKTTAYHDNLGNLKDLSQIVYNDALGRSDSVVVDTAAGAPIRIRASFANSAGLEDSTWKVDYGKVRMLYDKNGNLRFMMNDKRMAEGTFVYYKYDAAGRRVEEGVLQRIIGGVDTWTQANADAPGFPGAMTGSTKDVKFRWFYDYFSNGTVTLVAPGKLVRVDDSLGSYYRNFYYYPNGDSDLVVVKLPQGSGTEKAIRHYYRRDGGLDRMAVYPKYPTTTGRRVFTYSYDKTGKLAKVSNGLTGEEVAHDYGTYVYNPDGACRRLLLGVYSSPLSIPPAYDTLQKLDYRYSPTGQLIAINSYSGVVGSMSGGASGIENDHFGLELSYQTVGNAYYNGRPSRLASASSSAPGRLERSYDYTYNELDWLSFANEVSSQNDQRYYYNALGQRTRLITYDAAGQPTTTDYTYDTSVPGSSRLLSYTGMGSFPRRYDVLGNLIADTSRSVYSLQYDYRNLLTYALAAPNVSGGSRTTITSEYDETGNRIRKSWTYNYWADCGPITEPDPIGGISSVPGNPVTPADTAVALRSQATSAAGVGNRRVVTQQLPDQASSDGSTGVSSIGPGNPQCLYTGSASTYYLFDGNLLLATFDQADNVIELFVNGPSGKLAVYQQNNNQYLYYFITDQVGSTRLLMKGVPPSTTNSYEVAEYYDYQPFGQVQEVWGYYNSPYQFTGKEHDVHTTYDYSNFGVRNYDARLGIFSTIDKPGQYVSGYLYGSNNPVLAFDPDGNWFGIDDLIISAVSFVVSFVSTGITTGDWGKAFEQGLISAGAAWLAYNTGGLAAHALGLTEGGAMYALTSATVGGAVGGATGAAVNEIAYGQKLGGMSFWSAVVSGVGGGLAGGLMGRFVVSDPILTGMLGGGVGGMIQGSYYHNLLGGFMGGMSSGAFSAALTVGAYDTYGEILTKKQLKMDAYGTDAAPNGNDNYACSDFAGDLMNGEGSNLDIATFYDNGGEVTHVGVVLGKTQYGEHMVLSKEGFGGPIMVRSAGQLSAGTGMAIPIGATYNYQGQTYTWNGYGGYIVTPSPKF